MADTTSFKLDFVGVGAAKAGTSWISAVLDAHPQVCMGKNKELDYFLEKMPLYMQQQLGTTETKMRPKGVDWLKKQFTHCQPDQLKGEYSPRYFNDPGSPRLIHDHNPDCKLIFNFRNPVDAVWSFYHHYRVFHPVDISFEEAFESMPEGRAYFTYINWIVRWLEYFPREQIHVILMDDIKEDREQVYRDLCEYLEIDPVELDVVQKQVNPAKQIRSKKLLRALYTMSTVVGRSPMLRWTRDRLKYDLRLGKAWDKVKRLNIKREKYEEMPPEIRAKVIDAFREPNRRLGKFLNRDLSHWNQ